MIFSEEFKKVWNDPLYEDHKTTSDRSLKEEQTIYRTNKIKDEETVKDLISYIADELSRVNDERSIAKLFFSGDHWGDYVNHQKVARFAAEKIEEFGFDFVRADNYSFNFGNWADKERGYVNLYGYFSVLTKGKGRNRYVQLFVRSITQNAAQRFYIYKDHCGTEEDATSNGSTNNYKKLVQDRCDWFKSGGDCKVSDYGDCVEIVGTYCGDPMGFRIYKGTGQEFQL